MTGAVLRACFLPLLRVRKRGAQEDNGDGLHSLEVVRDRVERGRACGDGGRIDGAGARSLQLFKLTCERLSAQPACNMRHTLATHFSHTHCCPTLHPCEDLYYNAHLRVPPTSPGNQRRCGSVVVSRGTVQNLTVAHLNTAACV